MPNGKGIVRVHNVPFPLHLGVPGHINSEQCQDHFHTLPPFHYGVMPPDYLNWKRGHPFPMDTFFHVYNVNIFYYISQVHINKTLKATWEKFTASDA
jgi:hypothetical protein